MSSQEQDRAEIRQLLVDWSAAVRRKDYDGVLRNHSSDILMFDVPPPFQSEGLDAYRETWTLFFGWTTDAPRFELSDVRITAGPEVAFVTAHGKCFGPHGRGGREEVDFRLTLGLRKTDS